MFSQAIWIKRESSISANIITAPNGTLTADKLIDTAIFGQHRIDQTSTINAGVYTFSVFLKKAEIDTAYIRIGLEGASFNLTSGTTYNPIGVTSSIVDFGDGWYRCIITKTNSVANEVVRINLKDLTNTAYTGNGIDGIYLWGAQLVEGTSALDYQATETRLNIPRLDYSLGSCPNILLEPQRTNLALQSASFDSVSWSKTASSVTANSTTSPSGVVDADTWTGNGALAAKFNFQTASIVSGTTYTISIYAKKNTNNFIQLGGGTATFGANAWANFDLNLGVVGSVGSGTTARIENVSNGWYRCIVTAAATTTANTTAFVLTLVTSSTSLPNEINTLSTSVFLWGAQLELGAYQTSYIPTSSASVTRNADVIQKTGVSSLIGQTEGSLFCQLHIGASDSSSTARMIVGISNGTVQNRIEIYRFNNTIQYDNIAGGVYQGAGSVATITNFNTTMKIAVKYSLNSVKFFINGVLVNTDTTALIPACSQINIGSSLFGASQYGGFINSMALFPTPLTDTQCIALTT
jgi:hypothetical protein